jgi:uncharacterized membrane protein
MAEAAAILGLWVLFGATHMGLSSQGLRPRLVAALGARGFLLLYSLVALALFVPLVWLYFASKHAGPPLWYLGASFWVRWLVHAGMGAAFVLTLGGLLTPSPASLGGGRAEVRGVLRLTRHPVFMGVGLFGLLHLLAARINAAELAFFAGFPVFALLGCRHQDRRKLAAAGEGESFARFCAATPFLPFAGPGRWRALREMPLAIALGIAAALLVRLYVHPRWLG